VSKPHVHVWQEVEPYCEDCGSHPGLRCVAEDDCPDDFDTDWIDLIFADDPRDTPP
jgi:hypothetical protein